MKDRIRLVVAAFAAVAISGIASAQCPPDCPVKGGGDAATDCFSELASDEVRLNAPYYKPDNPKPGKAIRCFDGDPGCDLDGVANNECQFDVDLCLRNADPSLPSCTPADVTDVVVTGKTDDFPGLAALQTAVDALTTATTNVCSSGQSVVVPLKGPSSKGEFKAAKFSFKTTATAGDDDSDSFKFVCVPRGWPSHGYDGNNTRATPLDTKIDSTNVATLVPKWEFNVPGGALGKPISATVTVGPKLVYTAAWDGKVYALDKKKGTLKWSFNTTPVPSTTASGIQSSVTLTADGRALVANSDGDLFCLDAKKGDLIWQASAGDFDPLAAHAWASPTVANNRVLMGLASHNDAPCVRGTLVAYDLDTGVELWRQHTVPERVCYDDTSNECASNAECTLPGSPCLLARCDSNPDTPCTTNADCPFTFLKPGTCVAPAPAVTGECWLERSISCSTNTDCPACIPGVGGGVTATPAVSPDGNNVYMASVGCLSRPSIGNSDSIFKLDASDGSIDWVYRTEAPEQFQSFPGGPTYHDYGFLNGPILATVTGGAAVAVAGGKDGTLYAIDQTTGLLEWSNPLAVAPTFAGFGLFNGSLAYDAATDKFFGALFDIDTYASAGPHVLAFLGETGAADWTGMNGSGNVSWSSLTVANDLVYVGRVADDEFYAFNTADGTLEFTFPPPPPLAMVDGMMITGGAALENGVIYIPYGNIFGGGGKQGAVVAFTLPE